MKIELQYAVNEMQASEAIDVGTDDEGVVLELASSEFYKPGSAEIREEAFQILAEISRILQAPRYVTYTVEIEGHTDDDPISTTVYPSNWELSTGRATRVVRFFIDQGMNSRRLKAGGFAETRPKVDNRDAAGAPIPENQATNRRVVIRVYPSHGEDREFLRAITIDELSSEDSETRPINLLENPQR